MKNCSREFSSLAKSISASVEVLISGYDKDTFERLKGYAQFISKEKDEPTLFRVVNPERMKEVALKLGLDENTLFAPYLT